MSREIVINAAKHESRIAVLDEGQVVELWVERTRHRTIVGNIYKGRVTKVLPGMQSAFVDLGLERDAFLYVSDVVEDLEEFDNADSTDDLHARRRSAAARRGVDLGSAARGAGDRRAGVEGHDRRQGRAHHQPHHAAGTLPRLHADGQSHRRVAAHRERGRAHAAQGDPRSHPSRRRAADSSSARPARSARKKSSAPI